MVTRRRAVIFDLDGVLVDTQSFHIDAWRRLASENGWIFTDEVEREIRWLPRQEALRVVLNQNNLSLPEDALHNLAELKNSYYLELLKGIGKRDLMPGSVKFLQNVREKGLSTALCSGSKNGNFLTDKLKLDKYFDAVVTGWDITRPKPDPEIYLMAADRLEVSPRLCVVLEDSPDGVEAAKAAGMKVIGIGRGAELGSADLAAAEFDELSVEKDLLS